MSRRGSGGPYPLMADLRDRRVVVVGGGSVAVRKVAALLEAGARPIVVAPRLCPSLEILGMTGRIRTWRRPFEAGDVAGARLVLACTDAPTVNARVIRMARRRGTVAVNAGRSGGGGFAGAAVLRRGRLTVAVSSAGSAPYVTAHLRDRLASLVPESWGRAMGPLGRLRRRLKAQGVTPDQERAVWRSLAASGALDRLLDGDAASFAEEVERCMSSSSA